MPVWRLIGSVAATFSTTDSGLSSAGAASA